MGQAINIVEEIMQNKENYAQWGLSFPEYPKKWEAFNMLVGENGSGKSRILQMIREKGQEKCTVIYLDFANYVQLSDNAEIGLTDTEEKELIDMLVFRGRGRREIFLEFLKYLDNHILLVFRELFDMSKNEYKFIKMRVQEILDDLGPSIESILHRIIRVGEDGIYLCKEGREVTIESEWKLLSPGERSILTVVFAVLYIKKIGRASCRERVWYLV